MKCRNETTGMKKGEQIGKHGVIRSLPLLFDSTARVSLPYLFHLCCTFGLPTFPRPDPQPHSPLPYPIFFVSTWFSTSTLPSDRQQTTTDSDGIPTTIWIRIRIIIRFISSWPTSWCRILIPCPPGCTHQLVHSVQVDWQ